MGVASSPGASRLVSSLEALEARIELDRETLLVYADELLAAGDPRGELIAIDLAEASEERAARRAPS